MAAGVAAGAGLGRIAARNHLVHLPHAGSRRDHVVRRQGMPLLAPRRARGTRALAPHIKMRQHAQLADRDLVDLDEMAVDAIGRSQGQCEAFWGERTYVRGDFIRVLAQK